MRPADLLEVRPEGLYCPPADVFIDPVRPVARAVITHGHADHARRGHGAVLATRETLAIMAQRYGEDFAVRREAAGYGETFRLSGAALTLLPAGHVLGSAQVKIECGGTRIIVSGDYKRRHDPTCPPFEPQPCDVFVTEATFALPVFRHPPFPGELERLLSSLRLFPERTHLVGAYALGKAQRMIRGLREAGHDAPIYLHGAMTALCALYEAQGVPLGDLRPVAGAPREALAGAIVVAPPSALKDRWTRRLAEPVLAFASGWMRIRARARQQGVELPLIVSDHADWDELTGTILEMAPGEVWVTHGREDALVHWCAERSIAARPLSLLGYEDEAGDAALEQTEGPAS